MNCLGPPTLASSPEQNFPIQNYPSVNFQYPLNLTNPQEAISASPCHALSQTTPTRWPPFSTIHKSRGFPTNPVTAQPGYTIDFGPLELQSLGSSTNEGFQSGGYFGAQPIANSIADAIPEWSKSNALSQCEKAGGMIDLLGAVDTLHCRFQQSSQPSCFDCGSSFGTAAALSNHANETQHTPYSCYCGQRFSRSDCLDRHIRTIQSNSRFECPYCLKYQGPKAFPRRDHLLQHVRGHHRMDWSLASQSLPPPSKPKRGKKPLMLSCSHIDCEYYHNPSCPPASMLSFFQKQSELTKHLREVHNESPFPCTKTGCTRINGNGFFRRRDLLTHQKGQHPHLFPPMSLGEVSLDGFYQ